MNALVRYFKLAKAQYRLSRYRKQLHQTCSRCRLQWCETCEGLRARTNWEEHANQLRYQSWNDDDIPF